VNIRQILDPKYLAVDSPTVELVVDGKLLDESWTHLLASIGNFCLFIEIISNEKECGKGISEPMPHFDSNMFSKSKEKVCEKGIMRQLPVPLLSVLWGDYTWKYICYQWRKNASVFLDVKLHL